MDWFSGNPHVEPPHASTHRRKPIDFQKIHQQAKEVSQTIKKEKVDVSSLNQHIAEIMADVKKKIGEITTEMEEKIRNISEERDLEVKGLKAEVDKLEKHIQDAYGAQVCDIVTTPLKEKYEVKLNM